MTPEEKFMFDLDGYLVIKDVLSREELDVLNAVADRAFPRDYGDVEADNEFGNARGVRRAPSIVGLGCGVSGFNRSSQRVALSR